MFFLPPCHFTKFVFFFCIMSVSSSEMNALIEVITTRSLKRRIAHECELICSRGIVSGIRDIEIYAKTQQPKQQFLIRFVDQNTRVRFQFEICMDYPFRPAKCTVNGIPYIHLLKIHNPSFSAALFRTVRRQCLCCTSICHPNNWMPPFMLTDIMAEYYGHRETCRRITLTVIEGVIRRKYLVPQISLLPYLLNMSAK